MTAIVKHRAAELPTVRPACAWCGSTGPDVATMADPHGPGLIQLCAAHGRPDPQQLRAELEAMWPALVRDWWTGAATEEEVFRTLCDHKRDRSPHRMWDLFAELEEAILLADRVADGSTPPHHLGVHTEEEAAEYVKDRVYEALMDLIGGAR